MAEYRWWTFARGDGFIKCGPVSVEWGDHGWSVCAVNRIGFGRFYGEWWW